MTVTYAALFAKIADSLSNTHGRITALRTFVTVQFRPPVSENVKAFSAFLLTDGEEPPISCDFLGSSSFPSQQLFL